MSYADFRASRAALAIEPILAAEATVREMITLSRNGRPAVQALDGRIAGAVELDRTERQHVGRWIRDVLGARGWRPGIKRRVANGRLFSRGAVYVPAGGGSAAPDDDLPVELLSIAERVARAQAIIAALPSNGYSVDDYLRDKYAEAALEDEKYAEAAREDER